MIHIKSPARAAATATFHVQGSVEQVAVTGGFPAGEILQELQRRAGTSENLLPAILAAVEAYATVGEISDAMRKVYGEYQESVAI